MMSRLKWIPEGRLALCEYVGRVEDIIGVSEYRDGTLARALKYEAERRLQLRRDKAKNIPSALLDRDIERALDTGDGRCYYHGWDTICQLCTGDISNVLELLSRIYDQCVVTKQQTDRIDPRRQDSVIETYSQQYIAKIKTIPKSGERLFEIVNAFGSMSGQLLREHQWIDRGPTRKDPYQLIRIEMDEGMVRAANRFLEDVDSNLYTDSGIERGDGPESLWILLQRYSIFIDAEESRSRRNTLASKVILRRIFCPTFRIALTNSESYTITRQDWEAFCADPKGTADRYVRRVLQNTLNSLQVELFKP
jgi:hypothetical protein